MDNTLTGRVAVVKPIVVTDDGSNSINVTAVATVDQIAHGVIKSLSTAAVSITTPTAASIMAELGFIAPSYFDFCIDNSGGGNTVTLVLDASITAYSKLTGGETLTTAAGKVGIYRLYFYSATAAQIAVLA
jgi:hypothetical protein